MLWAYKMCDPLCECWGAMWQNTATSGKKGLGTGSQPEESGRGKVEGAEGDI